MMAGEEIRRDVEDTGFVVVEGVLAHGEVDGLIAVVEQQQGAAALNRRGAVFAVRNLLDLAEIAALADSVAVRRLVHAVLGDGFFPVRGILFDKIAEASAGDSSGFCGGEIAGWNEVAW